jgi:hypothetical protein
MSEHEIQSEFVRLIQEQYPDILFCATVGGARMRISEAKKIKKQGYKKGIPDILFYEARQGYFGLAIEVKKKGGRPSPFQIQWRDDLLRRGYQSAICKGLDECVEVFNTYFKLQLQPTLCAS